MMDVNIHLQNKPFLSDLKQNLKPFNRMYKHKRYGVVIYKATPPYEGKGWNFVRMLEMWKFLKRAIYAKPQHKKC